jgi:hypothetical protein
MAAILRIICGALALANVSVALAGEGSRFIRDLGQNSPVIVFVHGVLGDSTSTWSNGNTYWPDLITHDDTFSGMSVYVHEYDSELLRGGLNINELANNKRWSHFLRQPAKVDSLMQRTTHHEDAETVFG